MERFGALEASMAETEKTLKKQAEGNGEKEKKPQKRLVKAFDNRLNLDASFLSNFNGNNGPQVLKWYRYGNKTSNPCSNLRRNLLSNTKG